MFPLIILLSVVLLVSGICSLIEAAILSIPLVKVRVLLENKRRGARSLLFIKENLPIALATVVMINNAVNVIGAIFIGKGVEDIWGSRWLGAASAALTFLLIVFAEIIPKTLGEHFKVRVSLFCAKPLSWVIFVLRPFVGSILALAKPFQGSSRFPKVTEEEIKIMLRLGRDAGTIEMDEEDLCGRVFKLNDLKASQMMKPIDRVYAISADSTLDQVNDKIVNSTYSRIAVYEKTVFNIVGIVQQRALLREIARDNLGSFVREHMSRPIFVFENERADRLLKKFQMYHQHLFIVRNLSRQNIGILTMEDVLEELFGEIYDEKDQRL